MDLHTPRSDFDCSLFVRDGRIEEVRDRLAPPPGGIDLRLFSPSTFASHAEWGAETAWDRYAWSIANFRVDRTGGELPKAAAEKGRVPAARVESYIDASLDWYLNQVARSLRSHERGDSAAFRLEAAEAARPFLQAAFALHDRRLVPYYGYLRRDLHRRPLERFDLDPDELVDAVSALVTDGSPAAHRRLLTPAEATFRAAGHGPRFDEWETASWDQRFFEDGDG